MKELVTHTMTITAANIMGFQGTIELGAGLELIDVTYEGDGGLYLNRVVEATTIRFELATASRATLSIQDAAGRVVLVRQLDAVAGLNRVDLTAKDLGAAGVLTYTLTSGDFAATKKMVVVR